MGTQPGPRVIVGVDRSIAGLAALRVAVAEAVRRGVPLLALRAQSDFVRQDFTEIDAVFAEAFGGLPSGLAITREVLIAPAADALTRRVRHPGDLLVIGFSARPWWRFWSGSVGRRCLRRARCPVLLVPPPEMARTARWRTFALPGRDLWARFEIETPIGRG